jgi:hypothetical protein
MSTPLNNRMVMYTDNLEPALVITLFDAAKRNPQDVNTTTASSIKVIGTRDQTIVFDHSVTPASTSHVGRTSIVTMPWVSGDTDTEGRIDIEVEVTWPGSRLESFRPGYVDIYNRLRDLA